MPMLAINAAIFGSPYPEVCCFSCLLASLIFKGKNMTFLVQGFIRTDVLRAGSAEKKGMVKRTCSAAINTCGEHLEGANQRQTKKPPTAATPPSAAPPAPRPAHGPHDHGD